MRLFEKLQRYHEAGVYPFHMPGHKQNMAVNHRQRFPFPFQQDITEITDFDNLHHAEGIILEAQQEMAKLYGVNESYFSINGSTAALLSAIHACVKPGGKILVARNCHKAVFHAIYLRNLQPVYIYPEYESDCGLNGGIRPENVDNLLRENPDVQAVLITSPTYDGIVSDVARIARIVHEYGVPLIVDEAHGAHFRFSDYFPVSAADLGADLVIQSLHKTLPAMTQTAVLHRCTERVDSGMIQRFMGIYQTSSPSYILMASIDACVATLQTRGQELFTSYTSNLEETRQKLRLYKNIKLLEPGISEKTGVFDYDRSKILLAGQDLHMPLRERFHLEMEMEAEHYITALTSVGDTKEGFKQLVYAVDILDTERTAVDNGKSKCLSEQLNSLCAPEICMSISEAMDGKQQKVRLWESEGFISAEFIYLYPPGVPIVAPGERITGHLLENMRRYRESGLKLEGMKDKTAEYLCVVAKGIV